MKKFYLIISIIFLGFSVFAQKTITGEVTNNKGETLPGVSVIVKGTNIATITDLDGDYKIIVPDDAKTLVFYLVGMAREEREITQDNIDVIMQVSDTELGDVVIIGYGTVKKKDLTGAVSIVDAKTIDNLNPLKLENALQGTVAGVNVTNQSGAPGAGLDIRIRGISTNGDASPVAIIDGYIGDISLLNPNDIETITVLKDAQAAIYGTVGANGIILITTKKGKRNTPTKVSINSYFGLQQTTRKIPLLNATEYAVLLNESYAANGQNLPYPDISSLGYGTDWQNELFSNAPISNNDINISGGSDKVIYAVSVSDFRQQGIIGGDKSGFKRNTARMSVGADLTNWLKLNSSITFTSIDRKTINDFGLASVLFNALNMPSTLPLYDDEGVYFLAPTNLGIEIINPLQQIENTFNQYNLNKFNGNVGLESKFLTHFTATARIGFNTANDNSRSFSKIFDYGGKVFDITRSSVYQQKDVFNDYTFDAFISYDNNINDNHHIAATFGTTVFKTWGNNLNATGYDIPYNSWDFADISLADGVATTKSVGSWVYDQRRLSYFARAQYDFKSKYYASVMIRRDASTKFGPDNAVAYFPSATFGWIISNESFFNNVDLINLLKLRVSYGILGSDKISDFLYTGQLNGEGVYVFDNTLTYGKAIGTLPNTSVKWEESNQFDAGFDLNMLKDKIQISADYFNKTTKDLLIPSIPVSGILGTYAPGAGSPTVNAGTVRNSGFEFAIGFKGNPSKDFSYQLNYNVTFLNNKVLAVNNGTGFYEGGNFGVGQPLPARMEVGLPMGYYYGYQTDGIFQNQAEVDSAPSQIALGAYASPGDLKFVDTNHDGVINSDDRTDIGNPIPKFVMGFNISLQYKGFDFVTYTYVSIGNKIVRNYERTQANANKLSIYAERWTGEGTSNTIPRLTTAATTNNIFSDFYVEDGSFLRIQNIQLGYTLPNSLTTKAKISKFRIYVAANNLLTLTKYIGYDPAASSGSPIGSGFDSGFYPAAKIYSIGLNINF